MKWPSFLRRSPLVVEHVRYVKSPAVCPKAKAYEMAKAMGMDAQAKVLAP